MSKQDGYASRTAADLERKYNFGQTFAEVYGLVRDAQTAAKDAQDAVASLDTEEIFNRLTNFGEAQGIYRGDDGGVYINASYIKSGKLAADYIDAENLKVAAANITGTLVATQIDTKDLKVLAANITGTLTAGQIDTTNLKVSAANVTGTLTIGQMPDGLVTEDNVTSITQNAIKTAYISASRITSGTLNTSGVSLNGLLAVNDGITYGYIGANSSKNGAVLCDNGYNVFVIAANAAAKLSYYEQKMIWAANGGCYSSHTMQVYSDRRMKTDISYEYEKEEALFASLRPCSFKMTGDNDGRKHWGFIAQDVIASAEESGIGATALAAIGSYEDMNTLAYSEFIALNTHMIQKLMARVAELEEKLA